MTFGEYCFYNALYISIQVGLMIIIGTPLPIVINSIIGFMTGMWTAGFLLKK